MPWSVPGVREPKERQAGAAGIVLEGFTAAGAVPEVIDGEVVSVGKILGGLLWPQRIAALRQMTVSGITLLSHGGVQADSCIFIKTALLPTQRCIRAVPRSPAAERWCWHRNGIPWGRGLQSSQALKGVLDDVRIYNRVLSAAEIRRLHNSGR